MPSPELVRAVFLGTVLVFAFIGVLNFRAGGGGGETLYTATEGPVLAALRSVLVLASLSSLVLCLVWPAAMRWGRVPLPALAIWAGIALSIPALLLYAAVQHALGRNYSTTLTIKDEQTLVTSGPYRFVRHPLYSSFVLTWIVFFLLSQNWFLGVTGLSGLAIVMVARTPREERMMLERFGEQYADYMARTGRYLPRMGRT